MTKDDIQKKTTQELNAWIEADLLSDEDLDFETLQLILEELERRAQAQGEGIDPKAAKEKFDSVYRCLDEELYPEVRPKEEKPIPRKKKKRIGRIVLTAKRTACWRDLEHHRGQRTAHRRGHGCDRK